MTPGLVAIIPIQDNPGRGRGQLERFLLVSFLGQEFENGPMLVAIIPFQDKKRRIMDNDSNINKLKMACEKYLKLLSEPEPGLIFWYTLLRERIQEINTISSDVLKDPVFYHDPAIKNR